MICVRAIIRRMAGRGRRSWSEG